MSSPPPPAPAVVAVGGLAREARIAAGPGVRAMALAGVTRRLSGAIERELERGACALMSFGIAGGIAENLGCGTCIVGRAIVAGDSRYRCDDAWVAALAARLPDAIVGDLAGVDAPVMTRAAKRMLHRTSGALAVDTESHVAAAIAAKHGLPFAALRVVADGVQRSLPPLAAIGLAPDGSLRRTAVFVALARKPGQVPAVVRTAIDARRAFQALSRCRRLLGAGLAFPYRDHLLLDVI